MHKPANVLPFDLRRTRSGIEHDYPMLLSQCRQIASGHLELALQRLLDNVDDALFAISEKAEQSSVQTGFFDAMRDIRLQRDHIKERHAAAWERSFEAVIDNAGVAAKPVGAGSVGTLSLIDEHEMEELVAMDTLIAKSRDRFRDSLFALEQRFGAVMGQAEPSQRHNPLDPRIVCSSVREAFASLETSIEIKLLIYKLYDQYAMEHLEVMYDEVNACFVRAGVLPQLHRTVRKNASAANGGAESGSQVSGGTVELPADIITYLQQLASAKGLSQPGAAAPAHTVGDLLGALTELQHGPAVATPHGVVLLDRETLLGVLSENAGAMGRRVDPAHAMTLDVISMIFDLVIEEREFPEAAKALICRLQIPLIKVALSDTRFFNNRQHPARRLLNELAQAGSASAGLDDRAREMLLTEMKQVVEYVLDEFRYDVAVFETAVEKWLACLAQHSGYKSIAPAAVEAARLAAKAIIDALQGHAVPEIAANFLRNVWCRVLCHAALKEGVDGPAWRGRCATLEQLVWSVGRKASAEERGALVRILPGLLTQLRAGMRGIGMTEEEVEAGIADLQGCHIASMRGTAGAGVAPASAASTPGAELNIAAWVREMRADLVDLTSELDLPTVPAADVRPAVPPLPTGPEADCARALKIGTWVEFSSGDGAKRGKLAWKDDELGDYVFVDRYYRVVADKSLQDLAEDFRLQRIRVLQDVGFLDRALDAMINRLAKQKAT